jgi:hypothetical protein
MAKPSRSPRDGRGAGSRAGSRSPARRGGQARPGTGRKRRAGGARRGTARIGWSRRAGIVLALLLLGTSVVLAGRALEGPAPGSPAGTPATGSGPPPVVNPIPIPPAPVLAAPTEVLVTTDAVEVSGTLPANLPRDGTYRLRIYVNDELARERRLPRRNSFSVRAVPLQQGENEIRAAIAGSGGESLHSAPISITRDDIAPIIRIGAPRAGDTVHDEEAVLRGRTEAGATLLIRNRTTGQELELVGAEDGRFEASIPLVMGSNEIALQARDAAGNRSQATVNIVREEGAAAVELILSRDSLAISTLPTSITLTARITDEAGAPADDADVTFSFSPPGQPTTTFRARSSDGVATWRRVRIPREAAVTGQGFATVLVTLPSGRTLQESARFSIR